MDINFYFNFRIYCNKDFETIQHLLAGFLEEIGWVIDHQDRYVRFNSKLHKFREEGKTSTLFAAPGRILAEDYGDILFKVENNVDKTLSEYNSLPINIRQRFSSYPNSIFIDCSRKIHPLVEDTAAKLVNHYVRHDCKAYIYSFNGQYLEIINSAYRNDDDKAGIIHDLISHYLFAEELPELDLKKFPTQFKWILPSMTSDALKTLKAAEILRSLDLELPDYSCIIIEYCKCVEIQIDQILLKPIRDQWRNNQRPQVVPNGLRKFYSYVFSENPKSFELGSLADLLELCFYNDTYNSDSLAISLQEAYSNLPFQQESRMLVDDILYVTRNYRNPAAHKVILSKQDMDACRSFVIGTEDKDGLLGILLKTKF
jgi:hypothetical protein